jgi:hypothetical protein
MTRLLKLLLIILLSLATGNIIKAQEKVTISDTLSSKGQIMDESDSRQQDQTDGNKTGIKQVRSARPDMSKSRGARPPFVTRPAGSGIPKGAGIPGGAKGPRGR